MRSDITNYPFTGAVRPVGSPVVDLAILFGLIDRKVIDAPEFARAVLREAGRVEMLASGAMSEG